MLLLWVFQKKKSDGAIFIYRRQYSEVLRASCLTSVCLRRFECVLDRCVCVWGGVAYDVNQLAYSNGTACYKSDISCGNVQRINNACERFFLSSVQSVSSAEFASVGSLQRTPCCVLQVKIKPRGRTSCWDAA